jgi:phosphatidylserine decarboxylase
MPRLFARNERVVTMFDTAVGPMALVLVGALNVGSMETVWAGRITPPHIRSGLGRWSPGRPVQLDRGDEMGRFNMGSTVVLLLPPGSVTWRDAIGAASTVRMGQALGDLRQTRPSAEAIGS